MVTPSSSVDHPPDAALVNLPAYVSQTDKVPTLPNEIWGEIAAFGTRDTVLNLRAANRMLQAEAERVITKMSLRGSARVRAFADAKAFPYLQALTLNRCCDADVAYLSAALIRQARPSMTLVFDHGNIGITAQGWASLYGVPLSALRVKFGMLDSADIEALAHLTCDISMQAYFSAGSLLAAAALPTIKRLWPIRSMFDDRVALAFRDHPLQELTLATAQGLSSLGLQYLAANRSLRVLDLDGSQSNFDVHAARAFAENDTLETLSICEPLHHFMSEDACAALSENRSLRTLSIPVPTALHYLGRMSSLKHLHLQGLSDEARQQGQQGEPDISADAVRGLIHGLRLASLRLEHVKINADALPLLLESIHTDKLYLSEMRLDTRGVAALLSNKHVRDLEFVDVTIDKMDALALATHPSLTRLSMQTYIAAACDMLGAEDIQALRAAWTVSGRAPSQLAGMLACS